MSDAFWLQLFTFLTTIGIAVIAELARRNANAGRKVAEEGRSLAAAGAMQSKRNSEQLDEIHEKVNGGVEERVRAAKEEGRRTLPPQVLIVDDEKEDLALARHCCREFGCDVFEAVSGEMAKTLMLSRLGAARGLPFDLIFVDMKIPGDDGVRILEELTQIAPRLPLVILTGNPDGEDVKRACSEVSRHIVAKPLKRSHLQSLFDQNGIPYDRPRPKSQV